MPRQRLVPLEFPSIFPERNYLPDIEREQYNVSEGRINDFSPATSITALNEGWYFSLLEALAFGKPMLKYFAVLYLRQFGVMRRLGSYATVTLTVTLTARVNYFQLSAGYIVRTSNGLAFATDRQLIITDNFQGKVTATATEAGRQYNVGPRTIYQLSESRAFLQGIINEEAAQNGDREETDEEAIARGFAAFRDRGVLITEDDFERYALKILGEEATVRVVGMLAGDKKTREKGVVHVFALNPDGSTLNEAQKSQLQIAMNNQVPAFLVGDKAGTIASAVFVSSLELLALELRIIVAILPDPTENPERRARLIYANLQEYLKPGEHLDPGDTVYRSELENIVRNSGVKRVESVTTIIPEVINGSEVGTFYDGDIQPRNRWTCPYLLGADIILVDEAKNRDYTFSFGEGGDKY
jgi:hypothetical protein